MCNRAPHAEPNKEQRCYRHRLKRVTHSAIGQQHAWQVIDFEQSSGGIWVVHHVNLLAGGGDAAAAAAADKPIQSLRRQGGSL